MTNYDQATPPGATAHNVLRKLAVKANGLTGADIERLARELRQKARRENHAITFADIVATLDSAKPKKSAALRWRMATHEAGHAIAELVIGIREVTIITIDAPDGNGFVETRVPKTPVLTEEFLDAILIATLAGRAAEEELLGTVVAGSGGTPDSDLAKATELAQAMETTMGFAQDRPLLYRSVADRASLLVHSPAIAERVNARLELAYAKARNVIRQNRKPHYGLAKALMVHDTLEGPELEAVIRQLGELAYVSRDQKEDRKGAAPGLQSFHRGSSEK
ncbi:ATP-dependent metallopeptidase FtsH/Yme1/Tma family protein [Mesorhizobium sp. A623]